MFKVVPDQLRISEGWVRCGHCTHVFDASAHMQGDKPLFAQEPAESPVVPTSEPDLVVAPQAEPALEVEPLATQRYASAVDPYLPDDLRPLADQDLVGSPAPSIPEEALDDVSFVRQARRQAFWRRSGVRLTLGLLGLVLLGALALQVALHERDRLAALQPALKPVLEALCQPLRCTVGPPRQIEAIVIDSSSFGKLRGDAYRLALTLKNQAVMAVAMPAIELTLTDSQDQPVLRRVLTPAELGAAAGQIDASSDWSGTFAVNVASGNGAGRVAGYRLLAFYP